MKGCHEIGDTYMKKLKVISVMLLVAVLIGIAAPGYALSVTDFADVTTGAWYYEAVSYAAANGLFEGTSNTTFSPNTTMSRGMFITVLGRLAGVSLDYGTVKTTPYSDINQSQYWFPFAAWGKDYGIIPAGGTTLNPNQAIPREEMAYMMYRYA